MSDEQPMSRRAAREAAGAAPRRGSRGRSATPAGDGTAPLDADGAEAPARRGIGALVAKHPTAWLVGAIAVVFVLLGTGAVFAGVSVGSARAVVPTATPTPEPPRDLPGVAQTPSRLRTCSIDDLAKDPRLMKLRGSVMLADTGEVLFDRAGDKPLRTASVMKILTAAAALATIGPDYRIRTSVYLGSTPGSIVLVGRGDATLSQLPAGAESVYKGAPKLADLAAQVLANYDEPGVPITKIVLDSTYWSSADKWDPAWKRSEQTQGYHSEVTALQVDGDRANPQVQDSPRSTDPVGRAGALFLQALRNADTQGEVAADVSFSTGSAVSNNNALGEVKSQPVRTIIDYMLKVSDNTMAEMLARIVSKESALNGSAASLQQAIPSALSEYDVSPTGLQIKDGSGLSEFNDVPAATVARLLIKVDAREGDLGVLRDGLPVAGESGTLARRFTGDNAVARGHVRAKTGWIDTAYTLAGILKAADGTKFTFAFYAIGDGIQSNAREALDTLTTGVYKCGDNLSNN